MSKAPCVFCKCESEYDGTPNIEGHTYDTPFYNCAHCGKYVLGEWIQTEPKDDKGDKLFRLACLLREHHRRGETGPFGLFEANAHPGPNTIHKYLKRWWRVDELLQEFPKAIELIDRSLLNLSRGVQHPMDSIELSHDEAGYLFFSPGGKAHTLLGYMDEMGLVRKESVTRGEITFSIAPGGWQRISDLQTESPESKRAFVAMWFSADTDTFYQQAIKPAVEQAGFDCKRIDAVEHNNKICDEIVAEIRRSRFIVADFTGQRGGVYFEAGYGMGMGLPVIWLVHKDQVDKLHFDTRQYNHIVYESAEDLKQKLYNRIAATIH